MTTKELGIRLYYLRRHKTVYNQQHMAQLLHISRSTYTKYETGVTVPPLEILENIKNILGVSFDELLTMPLRDEEIIDYEIFKIKKRPLP